MKMASEEMIETGGFAELEIRFCNAFKKGEITQKDFADFCKKRAIYD